MSAVGTEVTTIVTSVTTAVALGALAVMGRSISHGIRGMRDDVRRFMREHLYLLRVADWAKVNLSSVLDHLDLTPTEPPPLLPAEERQKR